MKIKNVTYILTVLLIVTACNSENQEKEQEIITNGTPVIEFETMSHDFGTIERGEIVSNAFKYKNSGDAHLIISHVQTTCGCTVTNYSKEPLAPGGEGFIEVVFDSAGRRNNQSKTVTVYSNAKQKAVELKITAFVNAPLPIKSN